ncbi:MAG TPA: hypothetical protein DHV37_05800 [Erysipelotrichaceae bacterium]|nr:hypothetical protein [Erysipelotrichaceae bacterium]
MSEINKIKLEDASGQLIGEYDLGGTDTKVTQTETTTDAEYEILFSGTADNTTRTEGAGKSQYFKFNPLLRSLTVGTRNTSHNDYSGSIVLGGNCAAHSNAMAQGLSNIAVGDSSHAEGVLTYANGEGSHTEGRGTRAQADYQHVEGKYNLYDFDNDYAHIIGNGYYDENNDREMRSNAFGVRWDGQVDVYNDIVRQDTNGTWDGIQDPGYNYHSLVETLTAHRNMIDILKSELINTIYPVGSVYMSTTEDTVAKVQAKFGGTWQKIEGRFLLSSSSAYSAGSTGGSANAVVVSHDHTFTGKEVNTNNTGAHTHYLATVNSGNNSFPAWALQFKADAAVVSGSAVTKAAGLTSSNGAHQHKVTAAGTVGTKGESGIGKNMPPYLVVHMYKRTA